MAEKLALVEMLLDSDSSDEDDFMGILNALHAVGEEKHKIIKINNSVEIVKEYNDEEFRRHFRMSRSTFMEIKGHFELFHFFPNTQKCGVPVKSSETYLLSFLWFAGNKCCIRDVANRFGMAESTFFSSFQRVLEFLIAITPDVIKFPSNLEGKLNISRAFEGIKGFPNVLGCIDGTYIPINNTSTQN